MSSYSVSVVIPMYNAEEFIGECLDSLLLQTMQDFEVIVADDCSTDNSVEIVKEYEPKFDGRLQFTQTEKNSGGGGYIPRNLGLSLASGKYVIFLDSDDFLLGSALETLYNAAENYNADVVYSSIYYDVVNPNDVYLHRDGFANRMLKKGVEDKTDFTEDNTDKIFQEFLAGSEGNFRAPWSKFIRRDFLIDNAITFPDIVTGGDCIWCIDVYAHAKRFLRLPIPLYFYRRYNTSITRTERTSKEQLSYWVTAFIAYLKALNELQNKNEVLKENPNYCYEAVRGGHFEWVLNRTSDARQELTNPEVYEVLYNELSKLSDSSAEMVPFFFSVIDKEKKVRADNLQTIKDLRNEVRELKKPAWLTQPVIKPSNPDAIQNLVKDGKPRTEISIVIPMYNSEKFIHEALESILLQTFPHYEVIVVDDCSKDNSVAVVKSYISKFNGRLKVFSLEKNSGAAPAPRNKGFLLSRGEYIFFMDSDDTLTPTALEEMYSLAKEYNADCVYCEQYYMSEGFGQEYIDNIHITTELVQKPPFVDKPTFISNNLADRIDALAEKRFWVTPWQRLVTRDLLADNKITFPEIIGRDDDVWCFQVLCCAKRFLRVPNACYVRRMYDESFTQASKKSPNRHIHQWLDIVVRGSIFIDKFLSKFKFFQDNPDYRYKAMHTLFAPSFDIVAPTCAELNPQEVYDIFMTEFGKDTDKNDTCVSFVFSYLYNMKNAYNLDKKIINRIRPYITARMDIKLNSTEGDFEILSVSDARANVMKPPFLNKDSIGYQIQSHEGKLEFIAKSSVNGRINLVLRGMDIRNPDDRTKRIPYWVDFTRLVIGEKTVIDKATPVWHDKTFTHSINAKAGEEIKIQVEWQPHREDTINVSANTSKLQKESDKKDKRIAELQTALDNEKKVHGKDLALINRLENYLTARADIKFMSTEGDFEILSVSDERATIEKPYWFQKKGIGYTIQSYEGKLEFIAKASADGEITLALKGLDVRNSENERIPYWIDYTNLTVNGETIFDTITPAWHDEDYNYTINAKADEEITVQLEWLPRKGDAYDYEADKEILSRINNFITARADIKLWTEEGKESFKIISVSDKRANVEKPYWFQKKGVGYQITSYSGNLKFTAQALADGKITMALKGMDVRDSDGKRIPYWIDYTKLVVNGETIFDEITPAWHDKVYDYITNLKAGEELNVQLEWLPHRSDT